MGCLHSRAQKTLKTNIVSKIDFRVQAYSSLPDGGYTLTIQAQDGAGNTNGTPVTRSWNVTMPQGSYAQITVRRPQPHYVHQQQCSWYWIERRCKHPGLKASTGSAERYICKPKPS